MGKQGMTRDNALLMSPNIDSITSVIQTLLERSKCPPEDRWGLLEIEQEVSLFTEEFFRIVLDWIGAARIKEIKALTLAVEYSIDNYAKSPRFLEEQPVHERLIARLSTCSNMMSLMLRTRNLARHLGLLVGDRRVLCRSVLSTLDKLGRPVRTSEVWKNLEIDEGEKREEGEKRGEGAIRFSLEKLTMMELVHKSNEEPGAVTYSLTWSGRGVNSFLSEQKQRRPVPPEPHPSPSEPHPSPWQGWKEYPFLSEQDFGRSHRTPSSNVGPAFYEFEYMALYSNRDK
jgi:hypothetical protein